MKIFVRFGIGWAVLSQLCLVVSVLAQPTISAVSPAANQASTAQTSPVQVTFSRAINNGSTNGIKVFSAMHRGMSTGHGASSSVSGNQLACTPSFSWRPGETVLTTITTAVQDQAGRPLARPYVFQFTAATGGTGRGNFATVTTTLAELPTNASLPLLGDMDNDGDMDIVAASSGDDTHAGVISVRLNAGNGTFAGGGNYTIGQLAGSFSAMTLGDVDSDGDLDVMAYSSGLLMGSQVRDVAIGLNNGSGVLTRSTAPPPSVGRYTSYMTLADIDADGDLDLVSANSFPEQLQVQFNNGSGTFAGGGALPHIVLARNVVMSDVDADGDLDLVAPNQIGNQLFVRLNDGTGAFPSGGDYPVGTSPYEVQLGDVDGDGDLDAVTANYQSGTGQTVSLRLNDGRGVFSGTTELPVGTGPTQLRLADLDGDGDLDLLTYNETANTTTALFNNGQGTFGGNATVAANGARPLLADLDGDNDLDLLTLAPSAGTAALRLNQPSSTLPVELVAFTAERRGESAWLRWKTAQEKDNRGFAVEASTDGREYRRLGWVPGQGTTSAPTSYQFEDPALLRYGAASVYYRLRQLDADATEHFSPVRAVALAAPPLAVQAAPNPFRHTLAVQVVLPRAGAAQLHLYDALGRACYAQALDLPAGLTSLPLPEARQWPAGLYTLLLQQDGRRQVIKVLKE